mmetsp:Transcript_110879/g.213704  ORF Transcript_110879/g.213704 Transcript_110879/m.213704 type:complete len:1683 (+) Transcript_110879:105-5153(+)
MELAGLAFQHRRHGPMWVAIATAALASRGSLAGRCTDLQGLGDSKMSEVLAASKKNCPFQEDRDIRDGLVLAYRGWRSQQLVTEIIAYALEEILDAKFEFRDLINWPTNFEYQKNCSYTPPEDCLAVYELYGKNYSGCMRPNFTVGGGNGGHNYICSTALKLDPELNPNDLRYCSFECRRQDNTCYDIDVEVSADHRSPEAKANFARTTKSLEGWGVDLGVTGYLMRQELFYWPPSVQPTSDNATAYFDASLAAPRASEPFLDWYASYVSNESMLRIFQPLPGMSESAADIGPCGLDWNLTNPLFNVDEWCTDGSYIPPQCRDCTDCCGEIYHFHPGFSMGEVEALVTTHKWPFRITYLHETVYKSLQSHGKPFIAFTSSQYTALNVFPDAVKIQFPVQNANMRCFTRFLSSPEDKKYCAPQDYHPNFIVSRSLYQEFPAAMLLVEIVRGYVKENMMNQLLEQDALITRNGEQEPKIKDSAACNYIKANLPSIQGSLKYCDNPKQPVNLELNCDCLPGTYIDFSFGKCLPCKRNHYCLGGMDPPQKCGNHSVSEPGSGDPWDCICLPGYGINEWGECSMCEGGFFKLDKANTICQGRCQVNSWSEPGASHQLDCFCLPGYYLKLFDVTRESNRLDVSRGECVKCDKLPGGEGVICPGDARNAGDLPPDIPIFQGAVGIPHRMPYAKAGWFLTGRGVVESTTGYEVMIESCSTEGVCLGLNKCIDGHYGLTCGQCKPGYAKGSFTSSCNQCFHLFNLLILLLLYVVFFLIFLAIAGVMTRNAVMHVNNSTAFLKILLHMAIVTAPVMLLEPVWYGIRFLCWPAYVPRDAWWSLGCLADLFHFRGYYHMSWLMVVVITIWPIISLTICGCIVHRYRRKYQKDYDQAQYEVRSLEEIIRLCDTMSDLRMADAYMTTRRMENLKIELLGHLSNIIYNTRILRIWRTVYREKEIPSAHQDIKMFLIDSHNIILMHFTVIYSHVIPKIISSFIPRTFGLDLGTRLMTDPDVKFFSLGHIFILPVSIIGLMLFGIGFPLYIYMMIFEHRHELAQEWTGKRIGWLYHGFKVRAPYCYAEIMLLAERCFVLIILEGYIPRVANCLLYMVGAVTSVLFHSRFSPFEDQNYRILDRVEGAALIIWCLVAAAFDQVRSLKYENELFENYDQPLTRVLVYVIPVFYCSFWVGVAISLMRTLRQAMYNEDKIRAGMSRKTIEVERSMFDRTGRSTWERMNDHMMGVEQRYQLKFIRMGIRTRTMADPKARSESEADLMLKEMFILPGKYAFNETFMLDDAIEEVLNSAAPLDEIEFKKKKVKFASLRRHSAASESELTPAQKEFRKKLVQFRTFKCPQFELMAIADVVTEALYSLITTHGIASLPFSSMEFVWADAFHFAFWAKEHRARQQAKIYKYIQDCPGGKEQGISDIFDMGDGVPRVTNQTRIEDLKKAARGGGHDLWKYHALSVRMLEEYVVYLECQDSEVVRECVEEFDKEIQKFRRTTTDDTGIEKFNKSTQTYLFAERSTQTEHLVHAGTYAGVPPDTPEAGIPGLFYSQIKPLQKAIAEEKYEEGTLATRVWETKEEEVVAQREQEVIREEIIKACQEEMTLIDQPAPWKLTNGTTNGQDHQEEHKDSFFGRMGHAFSHARHRDKGEQGKGSQASQTIDATQGTQATQTSEIALDVQSETARETEL